MGCRLQPIPMWASPFHELERPTAVSDRGAFLEVIFYKEGVKVTGAPETVLQLRGNPGFVLTQACPALPVSAPHDSPPMESPERVRTWGGGGQVAGPLSGLCVHRMLLGAPRT